MKSPHILGRRLKHYGALVLSAALLLCAAAATPALAQLGHAAPGQIGLQTPVTPIAHEIQLSTTTF